MPRPRTQTFTIRKHAAGLLDVRTDIDIAAPPPIAAMLAGSGRLPAALDAVRLADVELGVSVGDKAITFGAGARKVAFSSQAGSFGALGAYRDRRAMLTDLAAMATGEANARIPLDALPLADVRAQRYFVLYAGYGAQASANGSVALSPAAAANFSAQGGRKRAFTVLQAHAEEPRVDRAVRGLVDAWRLPSQICGPDDLPPGTWIAAEVSGGVQANAGVNFGLDFNWVRGAKAGELQGDIGLAIQAGAAAAFGYSLSDRFAIIVGRDSLDPAERKIRVRLHRLNERGWSFAASANLSLSGSTGKLLPAQLDDFIAATLGVHGLQTLQEVRRLADPNRPLGGLAADFLERRARRRFDGSLARKLDQARAEALDWFAKWDALPAQASAALWDIARLDKKQVEAFVREIESLAAADEQAVQTAVAQIVGRGDYAQTPLGLWLEKIAAGRVMGVLASLPQAAEVREAAGKTLAILEDGLLDELQDYVETQVGLAPVRGAIARNDFKSLNPKLKAKLAEFLGRSRLDSSAVESIRQTVATLDRRGGDLYAASVKALNQRYRFTFDYAYQRSVAKTALLDVSFDFAAPQAGERKLGELLQAAIAGDFRGVLPPPGERAPAGVVLHEAALTHHIQRSTSVKITLPFFSSKTLKQSSSMAGFRVEAEDGGVRLYALDAEDDVRSAGKWRSTLSLGISSFSMGGQASPGVCRHDRDSAGATLDYRFTRRLPALRTAHFERLLDVLGPAYFPHALGGAAAPDKPSAHEWSAALDKTVDGVEAEREDGLIGDSLLQLDVSLPAEAAARWLAAPADKRDRRYMPLYTDVSRRIQRALRRYIAFLYFQDARNYRNLQSAYPLLAYAALPLTGSIRVKGGKVVAVDTGRDVYWDWVDDSASGDRRALLFDGRTALALRHAMAEASKVLVSEQDDELRRLSRFYAPSELESVRKSVLDGSGKRLFESLLSSEAGVIGGAVKAGVSIAKFRASSANPERAVEELARFGERITKTFHRKLRTIFKPTDPADREALRNLGLLIFAQVSEAFPPSTPIQPTARLELAVYRAGGEEIALRQALIDADACAPEPRA